MSDLFFLCSLSDGVAQWMDVGRVAGRGRLSLHRSGKYKFSFFFTVLVFFAGYDRTQQTEAHGVFLLLRLAGGSVVGVQKLAARIIMQHVFF